MTFAALTTSLLSPMVLLFFVGMIARTIKSDLEFPEGLYATLTMYLLLAIGLKGGYKLSITPFHEFLIPGIAALSLGLIIPVIAYFVLRSLGKFDITNAAALAAHYGSVSAVTFAEALAFHDNMKMTYEGFMPSLLTIMEVPAIIVAIYIARISLKKQNPSSVPAGGLMKELLGGKSSFLLIAGLFVGFMSGERGWQQVTPFFDAPFRGILALFLLEAGIVTAQRFGDLKKVGVFLIFFGITMPILHALLGIYLGYLAGLSIGGATILGVLAASASYIAAPAAVRTSLPGANPTYYLTASLAITFPFNIIVGLPLYHSMALWIFGS
jgi:hypothetical protein